MGGEGNSSCSRFDVKELTVTGVHVCGWRCLDSCVSMFMAEDVWMPVCQCLWLKMSWCLCVDTCVCGWRCLDALCAALPCHTADTRCLQPEACQSLVWAATVQPWLWGSHLASGEANDFHEYGYDYQVFVAYVLGFWAVILHQVMPKIVMSRIMIIRFLLPMCWAFGLSSCTR